MQLGKVELRNGGLKGLKVAYVKSAKRDNITFDDVYDLKTKTPVSRKITDKFKDLIPFVVTLLGLKNGNGVSVVGIASNEHDGWKLKLRISKDYTTYDVEHQMVDESCPYFDEVMNIITAIYDQTVEYLKGKEEINQKQFLFDYKESNLKGSKELADVDIEQLDDKEVKQKAIEALEKMGCIVLDKDDQEEPQDKKMKVA